MAEITVTPDVLTLEEAAEYLRISADSMKHLLTSGSIPARQINGDWRILKSAMAAWLGEPTPKQRLTALAGAWKDDETLPDLLRDIYKRRGRPMVETKPTKRKKSHAST
jgi:excisionase family DNA binding protein